MAIGAAVTALLGNFQSRGEPRWRGSAGRGSSTPGPKHRCSDFGPTGCASTGPVRRQGRAMGRIQRGVSPEPHPIHLHRSGRRSSDSCHRSLPGSCQPRGLRDTDSQAIRLTISPRCNCAKTHRMCHFFVWVLFFFYSISACF